MEVEVKEKGKGIKEKMIPKRILITRTDRLGDVILSTPVIRHMRKLYPDAYIAFMVRPENRDVVASNPHLDEVLVYDKYRSQKSLWGTVMFALKLKKKKFNIGIALHPTNRVHIMLRLAGIPLRIGYDRNMSWLLTRSLPHHKQRGEKHEIDYNFDLLQRAGIDTAGADRRPYMVTTEDDKRMIDSLEKSLGIADDIIAVHPGASCSSKRWPPERFALAADVISRKCGCEIVLVGGDETAEFSNAVISAMTRSAVDLTGMLRVGELAEFLSRCRMFISNDSGPVHIAVAVGTPVVSIFGRKDPGLSPVRWGPLGLSDEVLHRDAGCKKCLAHECEKGFLCLKAVIVEEVVAASERIWKGIDP